MWQLSPGQKLRQWQWQYECVLYNDLSGDTHLLGSSALALLTALQAQPASTACLARALDVPINALTPLLAMLAKLALIEARR
jgi:PqqD family protein of HPr-rel-A system